MPRGLLGACSAFSDTLLAPGRPNRIDRSLCRTAQSAALPGCYPCRHMRALKFSVPLGWTEILKRTGAEIYSGNCFGWAASLAYYFFLALFPALLFVVSL